MDTNVDDKVIHQIETNLSNNMNDNLFTTGLDKVNIGNVDSDMEYMDDQPLSHTMNQMPPLSRAEYIRQAREACLRQLHSASVQPRVYDDYEVDADSVDLDIPLKKKRRGIGFFQEGSSNHIQSWNRKRLDEDNSPQEIASFRALIIRTVCAIVIFLFIFAIDKMNIEFGKFSSGMIRDYVTANDTIKVIEDFFVTWLK